MDWLELINEIFRVCVVPLLGVLTAYVISYIKKKQAEITANTENELTKKYVEMLANTIIECVQATNQTYVDELKDKDAFDAEAQEEALRRTYTAVVTILSDEAKKYLEAFYGDLNEYIVNKIESEVKEQKGWF